MLSNANAIHQGYRMSTEAFTYDVFLSHSAKDKDVVRALGQRLKDDGREFGSMNGTSNPATASRRRSRTLRSRSARIVALPRQSEQARGVLVEHLGAQMLAADGGQQHLRDADGLVIEGPVAAVDDALGIGAIENGRARCASDWPDSSSHTFG